MKFSEWCKKASYIAKKNHILNMLQNSFFVSIGANLYRKLQGEEEDGQHLIVIVSSGSGDIYYPLAYLRSFVKKNKIKKYCVIYKGRNNDKLMHLFGITKFKRIEKFDLYCLRYAYAYYGSKMRVTLSRPTGISSTLRFERNGYSPLYLSETYKVGGYDLEIDTEIDMPVFNEYSEKFDFLDSNAILLSPYANSVVLLDVTWWEELTRRLTDYGYKVYTNTIVDSQVIKGSDKLFFEYSDAKLVLEKMKCFIALRSGLCDIVSSINAKKIILCTEGVDGYNHFNHYSLKKAGLDKNAIEFSISEGNEYEIMEKILSIVS
ncbi:MAG: hypothetical protein PHY47_19405 [Lachnospiraceae bacterium]|nr:hypothetical protein [Lachnospiraceae bacterium]